MKLILNFKNKINKFNIFKTEKQIFHEYLKLIIISFYINFTILPCCPVQSTL